jgi:hypothetical protein
VRLSNFSSQSLLHWVCNYCLNAWAITITCLYYLCLCLSKFFTEICEYLIYNNGTCKYSAFLYCPNWANIGIF